LFVKLKWQVKAKKVIVNNRIQKWADGKTKNEVKSPNHYLEEFESNNESLNNLFYNDIDNSKMLGNILGVQKSSEL